jgi:2-polyprenyl-6-methoxyphenol hydroxylase-like FAD-dependent oxidoreductase
MRTIIAGAGIGGLVTAMFLHRKGIACEIYERVPQIQEVGVGITLLPHAVTLLAELDLIDAIDQAAVRTEYMYYRTRWGQTAWEEPRGLPAGYAVPQFSIHRGRLHSVLYGAALGRLPAASIHLGQSVSSFDETNTTVNVTITATTGRNRIEDDILEGDVLIGADGIHSTVRAQLHPNEGTPKWSGRMLWRGATDWPAFLDGRTIIISGGSDKQFIVYPIGPGKTPETRLTNWAAVVRVAEEGGILPRREDWSREALREDLVPLLKDFVVPETDIEALVAATPVFWEFPMSDREPLPYWSRGRTTLLGDAAHPMYPFGANGAAQAILDAKCISEILGSGLDPIAALKKYESERLVPANKVVAINRSGGPEGVIDAVETRSSDGSAKIDDVLSFAEREAIVRGYAKIAGFAKDQLTKR